MTKVYRLFHTRCPTRARARVRLSLCVLIMGANLELMTSASSAATNPAAPVEMTTAASDFFYHTDDLYNVMAITDDTGAVADAGNERYEYADYGQPVDIFTIAKINGNPSAIGNPYLFTGRRYDSETGWYYYRTRYLDPTAGRFTMRDTIGIWGDSINLGNGYSYAGSSPVTLKDPLGLNGAAPAGTVQAIVDEINRLTRLLMHARDAAQIAALEAKIAHLMNVLRSLLGVVERAAISVVRAVPLAGAVAGWFWIIDYDLRAAHRRYHKKYAKYIVGTPEYNARKAAAHAEWEEGAWDRWEWYWWNRYWAHRREQGPVQDPYGRTKGNWGRPWRRPGSPSADPGQQPPAREEDCKKSEPWRGGIDPYTGRPFVRGGAP